MSATIDLQGEFQIGQDSANLKAIFHVGQDSADLKGIFSVQQSDSANLKGIVTVQQTGTANLKGILEVKNASSANLKGILIVRQSDSETLKGILLVGQDSADLKGIFQIQHEDSNALSAQLHVGQDSEELYTKFEVQHVGTVNIHAEFWPKVHFSGKPQDLKGVFYVDWPDAELFSKFEVKNKTSADLAATFEIYQAGSKNLYARMLLKYFFVEGWADLKAILVIQPSGSAELFSKFVVQHSDSADLFADFIIIRDGTAELFADAIIEHTASIDGPKGIVTIQQTGTAELKGLTRIAHFAAVDGPFCEFVVQPWAGLKSTFTIRHTTSTTLKAVFWTRLPTRLWTNRRYLNGVISLKELEMGDAILEYVIEGVMEDIQGIMEANEISYASWVDITTVPTLIRRATTYGVVASLYARKSKTFKSRVIPTVTPVNVVVTGDDERAMEYWEGRMEDRINTYLTTIGVTRLLVSTADQDPFFTTDGIVPRITEEQSWHDWNEQREQ